MGKVVIIVGVVLGAAVVVLSVVLGWYIFPNIVHDKIEESVVLKNGTDQFDRFEKLPITFDFKVYIFDVQNYQQVLDGTEKPSVIERGPYVYKATREKRNIVIHNNKISYYEYQHYEFNPVKSGALNDSDKATIINPAVNGALQLMEETLPFLLPLVNQDVSNLVFGSPTIFTNVIIKDFLFEGLRVCDFEKITNSTAHGYDLQTQVKAGILCIGLNAATVRNFERHRNYIKFSFLGHKNDKDDGHYTVWDGTKDISKVGLITEWQDNETLPFWNENPGTCNVVDGRDTIIYPPFIDSDDKITVFNTDICRTVQLEYVEDLSFRDVTAYKFVLSKGTLRAPDTYVENECYCLNMSHGITAESGCLKEGVMDLFTCYNAPILLSYPHFMDADEEYQNSVDGLEKPIRENYETYVKLHPETGTPLEGSKRVQFSMFSRKVKGVQYLQNVNTTIIPVLWLDEHIEITDDLYDILYDSYVKNLILVDAVTYSAMGIGIALVVISLAYMLYRRRRAVRV